MFNYPSPTQGDVIFFLQKSDTAGSNSPAWDILPSTISEVIYTPRHQSKDGISDCVPFYILEGTGTGEVYNENDVFLSIEEAQFELELRELFC